MMPTTPFWPDTSPAFLTLRRAVRACPGDPVIGLSGGADSLSLVAAACAENRDVLAVCIDHGLQPDSAQVAARAVEQAKTLGAASISIKVQVAAGNVEAHARVARYQALHDAAAGRPLWVAHTMDDQAETFLLSSLRGHPTGMAVQGAVTRPFLGVRRRDTEAACAELGLEYWRDPMNHDPRYARVRIRTEVLPLLREVQGGDPIPALATAAALARDDADALNVLTPQTTNCRDLGTLPVALRRRAYLQLLHEAGATPGARQLRAIDNLVMDWHGQGAVAVGGFRVLRERGELVIRGG